MDIKSAKYLISSPEVALCPVADKPEYAFIGRSNVGKSSLINMLTRNASLAKTSSSPGKTQMINHFTVTPGVQLTAAGKAGPARVSKEKKTGASAYSSADKVSLASFTERLNPFYFVDLPGYGFAKRSQGQRAEWKKMIADYLKIRENLMTTFVLIDSRLPPQPNDLNFLQQLGEWEVPFNMVFTKADKANQREVAKNVRSFIDEMRKEWEFIPRSFVTSALKFHGRKDILRYIEELNEVFYNRGIEPADNPA